MRYIDCFVLTCIMLTSIVATLFYLLHIKEANGVFEIISILFFMTMTGLCASGIKDEIKNLKQED